MVTSFALLLQNVLNNQIYVIYAFTSSNCLIGFKLKADTQAQYIEQVDNMY